MVDEGREDQNTPQSGSSSPLQGNVSLAGRWWSNIECCLGCFVIFHGIQTSIDKEPYSFVIFQGGVGVGVRIPCPPSGSAQTFNAAVHHQHFSILLGKRSMSMVKKYYNHTLQINPWRCEEKAQNNNNHNNNSHKSSGSLMQLT